MVVLYGECRVEIGNVLLIVQMIHGLDQLIEYVLRKQLTVILGLLMIILELA